MKGEVGCGYGKFFALGHPITSIWTGLLESHWISWVYTYTRKVCKQNVPTNSRTIPDGGQVKILTLCVSPQYSKVKSWSLHPIEQLPAT